MHGNFLLNDQAVAYLIHGQPIRLQYQTEGCWFVVINYNNGESFFKRYYFKKANGIFESVSNVYAPNITMWGIGWGVKKLLHRKLNINFFNTITQTMFAQTPELPAMPDIVVKKLRSRIHWTRPSFRRASFSGLIHNEVKLKPYDDHLELKIQLEPILKKQMDYGNK